MRYFIELSYKGTRFHGWQRQPNVSSIQEEIETQLSKMLGARTSVVGCGRTDAGVHAKQFFAHFSSEVEFLKLEFDPIYRLNKMLSNDVVIHRIFPVAHNVHAQYSAELRTYEYFIHTTPNPFLSEHSSLYNDDPLDIAKFYTALKLILNIQDFKHFCKSPNQYKHTVCNIENFAIEFISDSRYKVTISANRFLQNMIRLIMARTIDVARGRMSVEELKSHLKKHVPFEWKNMAYPQGLYLSRVEYGDSLSFKSF